MKTFAYAGLVAILAFMTSSCIFIGPPVKGNGNVVEETREVHEFSKIKASAGTNVYISQGKQEKVVVKADENILDAIRTEVQGDVLVVTHVKSVRRATSDKVYVTVKDLDKISTIAGANVYSEMPLKFNDLELSTSAGSNLKFEIEARRLKVSSMAGSNVYIKGTAETVEMSAAAGSNIKAEDLESRNCNAKTSSGANIYITVAEELNAKASSGGNVFYYGSPKHINVSSSSGGNVIQRGKTGKAKDDSMKQLIGTWKLSKHSKDWNMASFTLNADSSAVVVWGDSDGLQEKTGKWAYRDEKKFGNNTFGISINSGVYISVAMESHNMSSWGFSIKTKGDETYLAIGDDIYEKQ
jgi:hypothetical protein